MYNDLSFFSEEVIFHLHFENVFYVISDGHFIMMIIISVL